MENQTINYDDQVATLPDDVLVEGGGASGDGTERRKSCDNSAHMSARPDAVYLAHDRYAGLGGGAVRRKARGDTHG